MTAKGTYFDGAKNRLSTSHSRIIYVEGADDAYFLDKLLADLGIDPASTRVILTGGNAGIPAALRELVKNSYYIRRDIKRVLVLRDADDDPQKALKEFHDASKIAGLPEVSDGIVTEYDNGRFFAFHTLPAPGSPGDLEVLLLEGVMGSPRHDIANACLSEACKTLGDLDRKTKRLAQLYMALHPEDCRGVGRAFALGAFSTTPQINKIGDFLKTFIDA